MKALAHRPRSATPGGLRGAKEFLFTNTYGSPLAPSRGAATNSRRHRDAGATPGHQRPTAAQRPASTSDAVAYQFYTNKRVQRQQDRRCGRRVRRHEELMAYDSHNTSMHSNPIPNHHSPLIQPSAAAAASARYTGAPELLLQFLPREGRQLCECMAHFLAHLPPDEAQRAVVAVGEVAESVRLLSSYGGVYESTAPSADAQADVVAELLARYNAAQLHKSAARREEHRRAFIQGTKKPKLPPPRRVSSTVAAATGGGRRRINSSAPPVVRCDRGPNALLEDKKRRQQGSPSAALQSNHSPELHPRRHLAAAPVPAEDGGGWLNNLEDQFLRPCGEAERIPLHPPALELDALEEEGWRGVRSRSNSYSQDRLSPGAAAARQAFLEDNPGAVYVTPPNVSLLYSQFGDTVTEEGLDCDEVKVAEGEADTNFTGKDHTVVYDRPPPDDPVDEYVSEDMDHVAAPHPLPIAQTPSPSSDPPSQVQLTDLVPEATGSCHDVEEADAQQEEEDGPSPPSQGFAGREMGTTSLPKTTSEASSAVSGTCEDNQFQVELEDSSTVALASPIEEAVIDRSAEAATDEEVFKLPWEV